MKIKIELKEGERNNPILFANAVIEFMMLYNYEPGTSEYKEMYDHFIMMLTVLNGFAETYKPKSD